MNQSVIENKNYKVLVAVSNLHEARFYNTGSVSRICTEPVSQVTGVDRSIDRYNNSRKNPLTTNRHKHLNKKEKIETKTLDETMPFRKLTNDKLGEIDKWNNVTKVEILPVPGKVPREDDLTRYFK